MIQLLPTLCLMAALQAPPSGLRLSTWVREDLFSGPLANDMDRFNQGVRKLDTALSADPSNPEAIAWRASANLFLARRAGEAGDPATARNLGAQAIEGFDRARRLAAHSAPEVRGAVMAITAGSMAIGAAAVPESQRTAAWETALANYTSLRQLHGESFPELPVHSRGEILAGQAQASHALGRTEQARQFLDEIMASLPGTPYAARALRLREGATETQLVCATCHEQGRLKIR